MSNAELVEQIVQEVIRRLREMQGGGASNNSSRPDTPAATRGSQQSCGKLIMDDRVVSLAAVDGKLDGVRQVVVRNRAVVTPAVRDALRDRRIELIRTDA